MFTGSRFLKAFKSSSKAIPLFPPQGRSHWNDSTSTGAFNRRPILFRSTTSVFGICTQNQLILKGFFQDISFPFFYYPFRKSVIGGLVVREYSLLDVRETVLLQQTI
ncbi:hypothetical protein CDAR_478221 [Caerostris darwini]|uniref:Uncharacterized protein n=1 Tax=Caerostris darwini TaxID=1538125 RepID=A0AAV4UK89_9ARAC|nr:hypothetical protein CDAR_478221 [Caerostris darwini]